MAGLPTELRTGPDGHYEMMLPAGWDGTVTPTLPGFTFSPALRTYADLAADTPAQDYVSTYAGIADDPYEDNDSFETAVIVPLGTVITDLVLRDEDWFKFYVPASDAGKTLGIRLTATSFPDGGANADPARLHDLDYGVMDSIGNLVHYSMSGDVDEVSFIPDVAEGWYTIAHTYLVNPGVVYSLFVTASDELPVGTISGRVTDGAANGVDGVPVELFGLPFDWNTCRPMAITDANGYYKIASFPGNYQVQVNLRDFNQNPIDALPDGWLPVRNFRSNSYDFNKTVTLVPGAPLTGKDVVLEAGGTISGRVTDGQGNPVYQAVVTAHTANGGQACYGYTDANGDYEIRRLRTANFAVQYRPPTGNSLGREWYDNKSSFSSSRPVAVTAGAVTAGIDAVLEEGASVSGQVTDLGQNPIQGVQVTAYDVSGIALQSAMTQADGTYFINRIPGGSVKLLFNATPCLAGNYLSEWYHDQGSLENAAPIAVTVGQPTEGIDESLSPAGAISGRLSGSNSQGLLSGFVQAFDEISGRATGVQPAYDGSYLLRNLSAGNYRVRFSYTYNWITNYPAAWYPDSNYWNAAGLVAVAAGGTTTGIDGVVRDRGNVGGVSGRVTNGSGGGIAGLTVVVKEAGSGFDLNSALTDANGYYTVPNVPMGQAKVFFSADPSNSVYTSEYANDKVDFESADALLVELNTITPNVNAVLAERPALAVTTTSLAAGQLGVAYDQPLAVTGGRTFHHWTVSAGTLPDGLMMGARGRITGTPTTVGTFDFTARVSDSTSPQQVTTKDLSITVGTYTGEGYAISGTVLTGGLPVSGVALNGLPGTPVTNASGGYVAVVPAAWGGTVTPTLAGLVFEPASRTYSDVSSNLSGQDYEASSGFTISGTVTLNSAGLSGVLMSGLPGDPVTGIYGDYNGIVPVGWSGTVTPTLEGYTFVPESRVYTGITASIPGEDYVATAVAPISAKVDFNGDGQEDILWRYYGTGPYQGLVLTWLMNQSGSMSPALMAAGQTLTGEASLIMRSIPGAGDPASKNVISAKIATPKKGPKTLMEGRKPRAQRTKLSMRSPLDAGRKFVLKNRKDTAIENRLTIPTRKDAADPGLLSSGEARIAAISITQELILSQVPDTAWEIAGTGDFNGDHKTDILWRYYGTGGYQGLNDIWFMDGTTFQGENVFSQIPDTNWRIAGTGDFNGDGETDILWRYYGTGAYQGLNVIWYMNDATFIGEDVFSQVLDTAWRIEGTGDFNADGETDILWRYYGTGGYQGLNDIWFMNDAAFQGEAVFSQITDTNWLIGGTGDFNGDGNMDILWRYYGTGAYQGLNDIWYMNGTAFVNEEVFGMIPDTNWRIVNR